MTSVTMPPNVGSNLIGMLLDVANAAATELRDRVTSVRLAPMEIAIERNCECINFDFDGQSHLGELRGRNRDICIDTKDTEAQANRALAVRVMLDRHATKVANG